MFRKIRHDENLIANNYLQMPANVANKKSNVFNFISNIISLLDELSSNSCIIFNNIVFYNFTTII